MKKLGEMDRELALYEERKKAEQEPKKTPKKKVKKK